MIFIFKLVVVIDEFCLQGLWFVVVWFVDGCYDIFDLFDEWMKLKNELDVGLFCFFVNNIQLFDGKIVFDDQFKGKVYMISGINLGVLFIFSLFYQVEVLVQFSFFVSINGFVFDLKGWSMFFVGDWESEFNFDLEYFELVGI